MRTGVVSLAQNAAIPRLASTQIALASSCDYLREQNETNSDLIDALASVKESHRLTGLSGDQILLGVSLSP